MPEDETQVEPGIEVVGPPVLTIYFKNKKDDKGNPMAGAQEVLDFNVTGGALMAQNTDGTIMIFPLAELEYASLTPQLSISGGADEAEAAGDDSRSEDDSGIVLPFSPDFSGSTGGSEGDSDSSGA